MNRDLAGVSLLDTYVSLYLVCCSDVGVRLFKDLVSAIRQGFKVDKVVVSLDFVEGLEVVFEMAGFSMETVAILVELFALLSFELSGLLLGV